MKYTGNEDHSITLEEASKLTKNYRQKSEAGAIIGAYFSKSAFLKILDQDGCVGIRYYFGEKDDGTPEMILVGVDADGNDLKDGEIAERQYPCPPDCPENNELNS